MSVATERLGAAASAATCFGSVTMQRLINDILKLGGRRHDLEIKLVCGSPGGNFARRDAVSLDA